MSNPLIGLTGWQVYEGKSHPGTVVSEKYTQAVAEAGGIPVIIPFHLGEEALCELAARLDGLLFPGGGDVHPERYGSIMHPLVDSVNEMRDQLEIALIQQAVQMKKPFFGICRGIQVINVALGGTLYEDILDQMPNALPHAYSSEWPPNFLAHPVQISQDSQLAHILGGATVQVNSLHHQGIRQLAPVARPVAWAPDGLIEAIEIIDHPFALGVQWHPEWLQEYAPMRALFRALVEAART